MLTVPFKIDQQLASPLMLSHTLGKQAGLSTDRATVRANELTEDVGR